MRKRFLPLILILLLIFSMSSCASMKDSIEKTKIKNSLRVGLLLMQGENEEHITSLKSASDAVGIKEKRIEIRQNVMAENAFGELCDLAENGCNLIFTLGEISDDFIVQAATDYPEIKFFRVDSADSESSGVDNLYDAFFDETQVRYVSGIAAGYKLRELIESKQIAENEVQIGFVASFPDSEAISTYTAFYLGVKSVCENAVMSVQYTYDNGNDDSVKKAVRALIANGCTLVSYNSDSEEVIEICRRNNVYCIGENPQTSLYSDVCVATIQRDYKSVYKAVIEKLINGEELSRFVCADYSVSEVSAIQINPESFGDKIILYEAQAQTAETEKSFTDGTLNVFDVSEWTVNGEQIKSTVGEEFEEKYQNKEYIKSGRYFSEYEFSAKRKFAFIIDGITQLNADNTEEDLL